MLKVVCGEMEILINTAAFITFFSMKLDQVMTKTILEPKP